MPKRLAHDRYIFATTLALLTFGMVMVFSASAVMAAQRDHSAYYFVLRQALFALAGLAGMLLISRPDYHRFQNPAVVYALATLTIVLLASVFFLPGAHATHRWIRFHGISFQPSEMAKPVLILFLAFYLEPRLRQLNQRTTWLPVALFLGVICALVVAAKDLGATVELALIAACMLYAAGLRPKYFGMAALCTSPLLYWLVFQTPYRRARILAFLHPWQAAQGVGYQITQSLIAVGTGGLTGVGLMNSRQKLFFLPESHTDFIFAVTSEEFGWLGAALVVTAFVVFLWRGMRVARRAPDNFGRLLAVGVTAMIVVQAMLNLSVVVSLLPNKGLPLPFMSYGGSALFFALLSVGLLLNVSQYAD